MDALTGVIDSIFGVFGGINWEAIIQLTLVGAIMVAGPVVIFVLAARGGDL
jgi:Photosystem II complex subunit Ycf12